MVKGLKSWLLNKWLISELEKHSWLPQGTGLALTTYAFTPHIVWTGLGTAGIRLASYPARMIPPNVHVRPSLSTRYPGEFPQEGLNVPRGYNAAFASSQRLAAVRAAPFMIGGAGILQLSRFLDRWISPDPMTTTL